MLESEMYVVLKPKIEEWLSEIASEGDFPDECKAIYIRVQITGPEYVVFFMGFKDDLDFSGNDFDQKIESAYIPKNQSLLSGISTEHFDGFFTSSVFNIIKELRSNNHPLLNAVAMVGVSDHYRPVDYL